MTIPAHKLPAPERRSIINGLFVERVEFKEILDRMDVLRQDHREGAETSCMLVLGEPGVGKSSLLQRYAKANPIVEERNETGIMRRQPVVYVELDSNTTVIGAADTIMRQLMGDGAPTGSSVKDRLLPDQLRLRRTELLIIDEFQHVAETGAMKTRSRTADWVKSITKKLKIPVVMAGIPTIGTIIADNAQLSSITSFRRQIYSYDYDSTDDQAAFLDFLQDLDAKLPFRIASELHAPERGTRLHLATGGILRHLGQVIAAAGRMAIDESAARIGDRHLYHACEEINLHPSCASNPFPVPPDGS